MADKLDIIVSVKDEATAQLNKVQGSLQGVGETARQIGTGLTVAGAAITGAAAVSIKAFQDQARAESKLNQILGENAGATQSQIKMLTDHASALQKVGVIGDEVTIAGQAQLATFGLQADSIKTLSEGMLDLAVNEKGVNASQQDLMQIANLVGKAMTGQVGALSRVGITFSDTQAEILKTGDEMERAAVLSEVLAGNYGGLNTSSRQLTDGGLQALKNQFGDLLETIGEQLVPILTDLVARVTPVIDTVAEWIENNPQLAKTIIQITGVVGALALVLGPLLVMLPGIISAVGVLGTVFTILAGPVGIVIAVIAGLITIGILVKRHWAEIGEFFQRLWERMRQNVIDNFNAMKEFLSFVLEGLVMAFETFFNTVFGIFGVNLDMIVGLFQRIWQEGLLNFLISIMQQMASGVANAFSAMRARFKEGLDAIKAGFHSAFTAIGGIVTSIFEGIKGTVKGAVNFIISAINKIIAAANKVTAAGGALGLKVPQIPQIPMLATGGNIVGSGSAIVGEAGPELIDLPRGARVTPLDGSHSGQVININISGNNVLSTEDIMEKIGDPLIQELKYHLAV